MAHMPAGSDGLTPVSLIGEAANPPHLGTDQEEIFSAPKTVNPSRFRVILEEFLRPAPATPLRHARCCPLHDAHNPHRWTFPQGCQTHKPDAVLAAGA